MKKTVDQLINRVVEIGLEKLDTLKLLGTVPPVLIQLCLLIIDGSQTSIKCAYRVIILCLRGRGELAILFADVVLSGRAKFIVVPNELWPSS